MVYTEGVSTENKAQRLLLPDKQRGIGGAEFSIGGIGDALTLLDIEKPVVVKWTAGMNRRGSYRYTKDGRHSVAISTYLNPEQASETLWHELVHAHQQERYENHVEFALATTHEVIKKGYRQSVFEVEAREVAKAYSEEFRLTK